MVDLNTSLPTLGPQIALDITGWTLIEAHAISTDGFTIVGYGLNETGEPEAWVARLVP